MKNMFQNFWVQYWMRGRNPKPRRILGKSPTIMTSPRVKPCGTNIFI